MQSPNILQKTDLTYNEYLKVNELLSLQAPQSNPPHHDELLFIVIHQSYELWFKLVLKELEQAQNFLKLDQKLQAQHFINRSVVIMKNLVSQIHILETLRPIDFLGFRDNLMPASGFQSLQFREMEFFLGMKNAHYLKYFDQKPDQKLILEKRMTTEDIGQSLVQLLHKNGFEWTADSLKLIYENPQNYLELYLLLESCVDLDLQLQLWREHHVHVVERVIGFKQGTGGSSGVEYLRSTASKKAFPVLWELRTHLQLKK